MQFFFSELFETLTTFSEQINIEYIGLCKCELLILSLNEKTVHSFKFKFKSKWLVTFLSSIRIVNWKPSLERTWLEICFIRRFGKKLFRLKKINFLNKDQFRLMLLIFYFNFLPILNYKVQFLLLFNIKIMIFNTFLRLH